MSSRRVPSHEELVEQAEAVLEATEASTYWPIAYGEASRLQQEIRRRVDAGGIREHLAECTVCDRTVEDPVELAKLDVFDPDTSAKSCFKCPDCDAVLHPEIRELFASVSEGGV